MVRQQAAIARFSTQAAAAAAAGTAPASGAAKSTTKSKSDGAAVTAAAAEASRNDLAAGGSGGPNATPSNLDVLRQLMRYLWPEGEPALRARVVTSLVLLLGAKVCSIYVPFMFKNAGAMDNNARSGSVWRECARASAMDVSWLTAVHCVVSLCTVDMLNVSVDAGNVAAALPLAALIGCELNAHTACRSER